MTVKSRLLEMLEKYKGEVISGERIAGELGCTRAAVWKAVKSLREDGYTIEAGPNKGYMLAKDTNRLSQEGIRLFLDDQKVKVDIYDELESTNQTAKKEADDRKSRTWSLCNCQKSDCGQRTQRAGILFPCRCRALYKCDPETSGNPTGQLTDHNSGSSGSLQSRCTDLWNPA